MNASCRGDIRLHTHEGKAIRPQFWMGRTQKSYYHQTSNFCRSAGDRTPEWEIIDFVYEITYNKSVITTSYNLYHIK